MARIRFHLNESRVTSWRTRALLETSTSGFFFVDSFASRRDTFCGLCGVSVMRITLFEKSICFTKLLIKITCGSSCGGKFKLRQQQRRGGGGSSLKSHNSANFLKCLVVVSKFVGFPIQ